MTRWFTILASDLSTKALTRARAGVCRKQTVAGLPIFPTSGSASTSSSAATS